MILSLLLSSFLSTAQAVPLKITQQGRILDGTGASVSGLHDLTFRIYDSSTGGNLLWEETISTTITNGYYASVLGADELNNPLDSTTLELYPIYLEMQLDSNAPVTTRQAINSAPFAQMAGKAESAESVDGGVVNASEVQINSTQVIDGTGSWVGPAITVDWSNIDPTTIPSYLADGDDNTQLSETDVENYITNDVIDLAANSQVDGSDIVTAGTFDSYLPSDIADGDSDTLAGLSCATGEILSWDGNSSWVCTSDATLSLSDIETMLANNAIDLNASTTIGGATIVTSVDDSDTLAALSCSYGEVAKYDDVALEWYCDSDNDTYLSESDVETYITNGAVDLYAGTTLDGNTILTDASTLAADWNNLTSIPSDIEDGDDDTQLTSSQVVSYVEGSSVDLASGSTMDGKAIVTQDSGCTDGQILVFNFSSQVWACGEDTDTTLTATEMQTMIESMTLNMANYPSVNGSPVLTEASTIDPTKLDGTGGSSGQVLTTDGSTVSWGSASSGGSLTSPVSIGESDGGTSFTSLDTPLSIPDNNSSGVTSARYISSSLTITTLSINLNISHDDMGEITVTLTSPQGTSVTIYNQNNPGETNFNDNIGWNVDFSSGNLYSFNGEDAQGAWTLNVVDGSGSNTGSLVEWSMLFNETWDGELFVGEELTVQGTAKVRGDLKLEYGSDLVMTNTAGVETLRLSADANSTILTTSNMSNLTYVNSYTYNSASVDVDCDSGDILISGGCYHDDTGSGAKVLKNSYPLISNGSPYGWKCTYSAYNGHQNTVWAVCLDVN